MLLDLVFKQIYSQRDRRTKNTSHYLIHLQSRFLAVTVRSHPCVILLNNKTLISFVFSEILHKSIQTQLQLCKEVRQSMLFKIMRLLDRQVEYQVQNLKSQGVGRGADGADKVSHTPSHRITN